ncbi:MAG: replication-associated recombination protein A [Clostridia bacterium]|nr:replication-associated recombination protein A [Clostridia bacterium]
MDLFSTNEYALAPLADRMRPLTFDEFVGQKHIAGNTSLLRRAVKAGALGSCIFYGPAGCGKTTLANIIAGELNADIEKLNAVSAGVADCKKVIEKAVENLRMFGKRTYLLLDECHRFNKAQSDCLLHAIEKGHIIFIGSTTVNPYVSMTSAIVSRCRVFEFEKLSPEDIKVALHRALNDKIKGLGNLKINITEEALSHIAHFSSGDLRNALNALEFAALSAQKDADGSLHIDTETAAQAAQKRAISVDQSLYYDLISCFCKSLRGSDSDAALYYSERLISAGCDPLLIARRLIVHASEDVGMADPYALTIAVSAMTAFEKLGLPEGRIPLANAIIYVCEAEKSNSVVTALSEANYDALNNADDNVPPYLKDTHYMSREAKKQSGEYKYPHSYGGYVKQQYLPDSLKDRVYYKPTQNGYEGKKKKKKE